MSGCFFILLKLTKWPKTLLWSFPIPSHYGSSALRFIPCHIILGYCCNVTNSSLFYAMLMGIAMLHYLFFSWKSERYTICFFVEKRALHYLFFRGKASVTHFCPMEAATGLLMTTDFQGFLPIRSVSRGKCSDVFVLF